MFKTILLAILCTLSVQAQAYDKNIANQLESLYSNLKEPQGDDRTENSTYMVLESLHTAYISYEVVRADIPTLFQVKKNQILISNKLPKDWTTHDHRSVPVDGFMAEFASVVQTYKNYGVDEKYAIEFALRIQKEIIEALGDNWNTYALFMAPSLQRYHLPKYLLSKKTLLDGLNQVKQIIEVSRDYDIPYLAGYSTQNPKMIYIDRGFIETLKSDHGMVDLADFLYIHEVTEKLLIDEWSYKTNIYVHSHQFAQRLEKEMVEASGISWVIYQGQIMEKEIARADAPHREYKQTPKDLDMTPYEEYKDTEVIALIHKYAREVPHEQIAGTKVSMLAPGIIHVYYDSDYDMAKTLLRFQEFYESPNFRGKIFSLEEYKKWSIATKGKFDYYKIWGTDGNGGFNLRPYILETFFQGKFNPLSPEEQSFLNLFKYRRHANYYVVVTGAKSKNELHHELAHAFFYLYPGYQKDVTQALKQANVQAVKNFIATKYADYNRAVLFDEAHAYLMNDSSELKEDGFDIGPYKNTVLQLQNLFKKYDSTSLFKGLDRRPVSLSKNL